MKAVYVEAKTTRLSFEEASRIMSTALRSVMSVPPSVDVLALALAKTALETGRWTAIWNGNWGNIKAGPDYEQMFTSFGCNEVLKAGVVWFAPEGQLNRKGGEVIGTRYSVPPGHPQTRFRAYANPFDGGHSYVDFVAAGRYRDAWAELLDGDAANYVMALHAKGYFTADPAVYAKGVISLQKEFAAKLAGKPSTETVIPDCDDVRCWLAPQPWNVDAVRAYAQGLATESTYDNLAELRRDGIREAAEIEPERHDTDPAPPPTVPDNPIPEENS